MKTKTQELVTAGYALAKELDAESAKLVKELADELAVQRVRADELNKQVVNLAVESSTIKTMNDCLAEELRGYESDGAFDGPDMHKLWHSHAGALPATGTMLANIQAQVWLEAKDLAKSMLAADSVDHIDFLFDGKAQQLREEAGK
ncbi:Uncharacterised protein [Buttiauxella agrestis]|uniref:Uncharacterized protein n=1 Tax=Buttiauxella agrestis TaxID=82977 RepID=A0A381C6J7_9ENTR|nr:hypothetical protein [Buttiauxella agrestis]SUW63452.1 Uncharacterised protein [Buttiauxella agrestis]